jgi:hypothetical protein
MTSDDLQQMRQASLAQIEKLAALLQQPSRVDCHPPRLTEAERSLVLSLRQARIIEIGAIERFLQEPQTIPPRHKRRRESRLC